MPPDGLLALEGYSARGSPVWGLLSVQVRASVVLVAREAEIARRQQTGRGRSWQRMLPTYTGVVHFLHGSSQWFTAPTDDC